MNTDIYESPRSSFKQEIAEKKSRLAYRKSLQRLCFSLVITAIATILLLGVIFGLAFVKGSSMEPSVKEGDLVLFFRFIRPAKGDVVLLHSDNEYIKRIVGMPGDIIDIDEKGDAFVSDMPADGVPELPLSQWKCGIEYPFKLAPDEYFVLGDSRNASIDSRQYGPVPQDNIRGRVIAVLRTKHING